MKRIIIVVALLMGCLEAENEMPVCEVMPPPDVPRSYCFDSNDEIMTKHFGETVAKCVETHGDTQRGCGYYLDGVIPEYVVNNCGECQ